MQSLFEKMQAKAAVFKQELEDEIEEGKEKFLYTVEEKKVRFQQAALTQQKEWRTGLIKYFFQYAKFKHVITAPFIYALIVPLVLLDLFITVYQSICFTAYGIPKAKRSDYVVIDRQYLEYLNFVEKLNCVYCGYATGVLTYASEIAARTEHFWCPIKHSRLPKKTHDRYHEFLDYGDAENYRDKLLNMRDKCRACKEGDNCSPSAKTKK